MYRPSEIGRAIWLYRNPRSELDKIKQSYFADADLNDDILDAVAAHLLLAVSSLNKIHIDLSSPYLQEAFSGYWTNTESAILSTLEYAKNLHVRKDDFKDFWHSTNCLTEALRERWQPHDRSYSVVKFEQYCRQNKASWKLHPIPSNP